jgi:asparaginyl-tRNA synthetase
MQETTIKNAGKFEGQEITIKGWLYNKRSSGKIHFLIIRDGTGLMQGVMVKSEMAEEKFNLFESLTQESSIIIRGAVRKDERAPGGYEMTIKDLEIVQIAGEYPISKKEHGVDFLMNNRHLWLRSQRQFNILRIRNEIIYAIRKFFYDKDFVLIDTPILTGAIGETATTLFSTQYFDLGNAYLAQTGQLYAEAACMSHRNVFCFGPTFRAEKSKTRRHLTEFWMIEAEMAYCDLDCDLKLQEDMVEYVVQYCLGKCHNEFKAIERNTAPLEKIKSPFERIPYDDVIKFLNEKGSQVKWGDDLGAEDETIISKAFEKPVFVVNYPKHAKAFYMKENPDNPETVLCADLLGPEGYGEIIGGSQREDDFSKLLARIREEKLPEEAYEWYLDLRRYGSVPHAGFGLGVERTVAWICGLDHIRETVPFPRMLSRLYP